MNKICGYSCEHNKGGICQITRCIKTPLFTTTTEPQVLTRWQDPSIEILKQKVDKYKEVLDKIKNNNKRIIDYGFDYDGFNNVEDLKKLIDMLVDYARKNNELLELEEIE